MLCRNCHRENDEFASECSYCGSEIKPDYRYLISEVLNNNNKANEALYNATYKSVYFIASKLSNVMQNPDNVVAKSYDTALENLDVLTNKSNFPRWINSIAATIIISGMRKQRPDFLEDVGGQAYPYEFPYEDYKPVMRRLYSSPQTVSAAANFIYKLTDEEKLFYLMYYYNEMTSQEISRVFRISPATVSYHISSLNQKLRDELIASPLTDTSPLACLAFAKLGLERQFEEVFPSKRAASAHHEQSDGSFYDKTQLMPNVAQEHRRERPANAGYTTQMRAQQGTQQHRQQPPRRSQQKKNSGSDTASKLRLALVLSACSVIIIAAIIITLVLFKKENYDNISTYDSDYGSEPIEIIAPSTEPATEEVTEPLDRERPDFDAIRQEDDVEHLMSYAEDFIRADSEEAIGCYYILDIDYDGGMELIIREDIDDDNYHHEVYDITSDGDVNCSKTLKSTDKSYYMLREIERHDGEGKDYEFIKVGKTGKIYSHSLEDDVEDVLLEEYDEDDFFCGSDEHDPRTVYVLYSDGSDDEIEVEVPTEPETEEKTEKETEKPEEAEEEDDDSDKQTATVKVNDSLKLRSSPDTSGDSNILAKMPNGSKVELIDETKFNENGTDWYFVRYTDKEGNTHEGYAAADYIKVN